MTVYPNTARHNFTLQPRDLSKNYNNPEMLVPKQELQHFH